MKPIAIFRHTPGEGPGYFATFLNNRSLPYRIIEIDNGAPVPDTPHLFSGLVFMGGPMSVNDALPWIPRSLSLIRQAVEEGIPVMGHCLGGQLIAKALGGTVVKNPVKEIGWGKVEFTDDSAKEWMGELNTPLEVFHWHGETFTIPPGATRFLASAYCANQAFSYGNHLGMQCHVEMTTDMIKSWSINGKQEIEENPGPSVQSPAYMQENLEERILDLHRVADTLYTRWIAGLDPL